MILREVSLCTPHLLAVVRQHRPSRGRPLASLLVARPEPPLCRSQVSAAKGEAAVLSAWESTGLKLEAFLPEVSMSNLPGNLCPHID